MTFEATDEQKAIIAAALAPQCVIACPGSGKTATAVRRVLEIREHLKDARGHVALFSYSNVAVETFRKEYTALARGKAHLSPRVLIDTVDSFLTTCIIRPHAARAMGTARVPFLVQGSEPFLAGFTVFDGVRPHPISELHLRFTPEGQCECVLKTPGMQDVPVDRAKALEVVYRLGKVGAYTHELGRYWAIATLLNEERLLGALSRRYPQILVDEAQDVGPLHGTLLSILAETGSMVSLIGDPHQGIYDFAGADGSFLRDYAKSAGVVTFPLTQNRRSVGSIIDVANSISGSKATPFRKPEERKHGAYYLRYDPKKLEALTTAFIQILEAHKYSRAEAVIVCRGRAMVNAIAGGGDDVGSGATRQFAQAAVLRDRAGDIAAAYEMAVNGTIRVLQDPPDSLRNELLQSSSGEARVLRQIIWAFLRSSATGVPDSKLRALSSWQPALKKRLEVFFAAVEAKTSLKRSATWTRNLTTRDLPDAPLWNVDLDTKGLSGIRVDTVHQVKGEGIPVVLYLTKGADLKALLAGTGSEDGRIGYVAVTRAKDLLLLAIPQKTDASLIADLEKRGITPWAS